MNLDEKPIRSVNDIIEVVKETLTAKGDAYGPTYHRVATMLSVRPQYSILVRILEKCARCHNLLRKDGGMAHLREEMIDIACYAILAAFESEDGCAQKMRVSNEKPKPTPQQPTPQLCHKIGCDEYAVASSDGWSYCEKHRGLNPGAQE